MYFKKVENEVNYRGNYSLSRMRKQDIRPCGDLPVLGIATTLFQISNAYMIVEPPQDQFSGTNFTEMDKVLEQFGQDMASKEIPKFVGA